MSIFRSELVALIREEMEIGELKIRRGKKKKEKEKEKKRKKKRRRGEGGGNVPDIAMRYGILYSSK